MNRDSLQDEDEAFEQMDAPQATNADRLSDKKPLPEKDLRAPVENSLPPLPLPLAPPIAGQPKPNNPGVTGDLSRSQAPPILPNQPRPFPQDQKKEMELVNIPPPPIQSNAAGETNPGQPRIQGSDARVSFGTIEGQMKKEMPSEVVTRLNTILVFCYLNTLFLLIYFPITV